MKGPQRISTSLLLLLALESVHGFVPAAHKTIARPIVTSTTSKQRQPQFPSRSLDESPTSLLMVPAASTATVAAITGAMTGGLFAGALHAVAGPDHLAALLPRCCGQRWYRAGRVGALWGMGHGVSATLIGVLAFGLKNQLKNNMSSGLSKVLSGMSHVTEVAVGLSLILIGIMGIREAREWEDEIDGVQPQSLSAAAADAGVKTAQKRAVIFNGLLHGFSWDGAPSLAPAIAVATWSGNLTFLSAYAVGTMGAMAIVTTLIGEGTRRAGQVFQRPDIPQKLSLFSSMLAIAIGGIWCGLAFL
ncbi:high-affinity nickel-transport family protein [Seminavis robusta]|uniref:High-affinity nickel-transport family protein n=1 Tax=Seminavis robusta TaxID=568900 RepID=A0A9N8DVR5_9STRA|nr:high-affinity nickel-transport family protein [Seminavis robusta]|eukprot:Sro388_g132460.1 high-affinity nickel-transport family protein (303) ;mRNA; r:67550-68632